MGSVLWKGNLEMGMISIPIKLVAAARAEKVSFKNVNPETGAGVKMQQIDAKTGELIDKTSLVKAAEVKGRTVYVSDSDLSALCSEDKERILSICEFVKLSDVDPLHYDASHYVLPDEGKPLGAYELLKKALESTNTAAIGKMVRLKREHLVLIRSSDRGLVLHTLFYSDEVRPDGYLNPSSPVDPEDLKLAKSYIKARLNPFVPAKYRDNFRESLLALLEAKIEPIKGDDLKEKLKESIKTARATRQKKKARS